MSHPAPRDAHTRKQDTLAKLEHEIDAWLAAAGTDGDFRLLPLSFHWDGAGLTFATPAASPTGRILRASGRARIGIGQTRDVVLIDGTVRTFEPGTVPAEFAEPFAEKHWDARESEGFAFFRVTPTRILAWREENELPGRTLMRGGSWLV
ncbi:hypothetical protein [Amycolatopsis nigrescens]|uniref:pyridoxamine 5'-phosphate oxidase family protein n=1 Tax=Amycolatopsis nigrescens TaxID=381445 RepID=UPI00036C634D|nr:hypothetical protein [Amycolatopsis nigrescens]